MPIKPENKTKYPKDWGRVRSQILTRAGHKCEWCGVQNYAVGSRSPSGEFLVKYSPENCKESTKLVRQCKATDPAIKWFAIILTIAHVHDKSPENCNPENLAALCQRCHNRHDAKDRAMNRSKRIER